MNDLVNSRAKDKLKRFVEERVKGFFTKILDLAEMSIESPDKYRKFRAKTLSGGNDVIRDLHKELDLFYTVSYDSHKEDLLIVVDRPVGEGAKDDRG